MEKDFYCLEIKIKNKEISDEYFHSHLYISNSSIEIKIFIDSSTNIDRDFMIWSNSNNYLDKLIEVKISEKEKILQKIDISNSRYKSVKSKEFLNQNSFFTISLDQIYIDKKYEYEDNIGTAKVFLNDDGFDLVKTFYSYFFMDKKHENFSIRRMNGMDSYYNIGEIKFRPEFDYNYTNSKDDKTFTIEKIPILKFTFPTTTDDQSLINAIKIACTICSFYQGNLIDFYRITAFKSGSILSLTKMIKKGSGLKITSINFILHSHGINDFLLYNWSENFLLSQKKIEKAIENYIHSRLVDINSKFLLLYNIIEVLMAGKSITNEKFNVIVSDTEKKQIYDNAFIELKKTIAEGDYVDFENKWNTVKNKISFKPMKSPLEEFLKENNIEEKNLKISIDKLKQIRDKITHGSVNKLKPNIVESANKVLYEIAIKLILNQLGLKKSWIKE